MSDNQTSTLQSYVDSAKATAQSVVGSVTGNPADKQQAADHQAEADAKSELSHTAAKAGPFTLSTSGVATDNQDRTQGSWNQTIGSAKETVGNLVGNESLKAAGARQNQEGKEQQAKGQLSDLGAGVKDRVGGTVGSAVAGVLGDREEQRRQEVRHDEGKTLQRGVEADLQKQADVQKEL